MRNQALKLATAYAGYSGIQVEAQAGREHLNAMKDGLISVAGHMKVDTTVLLEAIAMLSKFFDEQEHATRLRISEIRAELNEIS